MQCQLCKEREATNRRHTDLVNIDGQTTDVALCAECEKRESDRWWKQAAIIGGTAVCRETTRGRLAGTRPTSIPKKQQ